MNYFKFAALAAVVFAAPSFAVITPSSVKFKVFGVAVSTSADCSSPVNVFTSASGEYFDFAASPTLGGGNPVDGTYNCVMITMSDQIKTTAGTTENSCVAGTEQVDEICQPGEFTDTYNGTTFAPQATCVAGEDIVTLFLDTGTVRTSGGNAFVKPTSTTDAVNAFQLAAPFVVSGTTAGTFVTDFTNKMDGSGGSCNLQPPVFSFR